ncbi:MAG: thiamine-phosphate kinase [Bacteroidales bacterium]|nr:thiamine-phosphate kinase [Bacteroidales bacterium]
MFEDRSKKRTELSDLGEFGLINHLTKNIKPKHENTLMGIGDDCAVIDHGDHVSLVTTDNLIEGIHFDLTYAPLRHLGYKAAVVNFSDIIAMNGTPKQMTLGISVSNRFSVEAMEEIYSGILLACERYNVDLIGGDTTSSPSGLFISITAIGEAKKEDVAYRHGAKEGDLLCVSGNVGAAYAGLLLLEREKREFQANPNMQPELSGFDYVLERQLKPEARKDIIEKLKELGVKPTSMIDVSDGVASEALHLCTRSKVGCNIYEEKLPIDHTTIQVVEEFNIASTVAALSGGEDYELLFTINQNDYDKIKDVEEITVIGHITDIKSSANLIATDGAVAPLTAQGWDAWLNKEPETKK